MATITIKNNKISGDIPNGQYYNRMISVITDTDALTTNNTQVYIEENEIKNPKVNSDLIFLRNVGGNLHKNILRRKEVVVNSYINYAGHSQETISVVANYFDSKTVNNTNNFFLLEADTNQTLLDKNINLVVSKNFMPPPLGDTLAFEYSGNNGLQVVCPAGAGTALNTPIGAGGGAGKVYVNFSDMLDRDAKIYEITFDIVLKGTGTLTSSPSDNKIYACVFSHDGTLKNYSSTNIQYINDADFQSKKNTIVSFLISGDDSRIGERRVYLGLTTTNSNNIAPYFSITGTSVNFTFSNWRVKYTY